MIRKLISTAIGAAIVLAVLPAIASAQTQTFRSTVPVTIPGTGAPTPNPTTVKVESMSGPVTDFEVSLEGVSHSYPDDLDVVLVAPDGARVVLMSDACGGANVVDHTWTFKEAIFVPAMADELSCPGRYYLDTNRSGGDLETFPGSGSGPFVSLSYMFRQVLNGQWKLFVYDDYPGYGGGITGWSLSLTTGPTSMQIPGIGTFGLANPYPQTVTMSGPNTDGKIITDLNVTVPGLSHLRPNDLDLLLVGPQGQRTLLMSDACGTGALDDADLVFDDEAPAQLPNPNPGYCSVRAARPTDYEPGDRVPQPAPDLPYSDALAAFDGTELVGDWKLFAFDDSDGATGYTLEPFKLNATTRERAAVEFGEATVEIAEGAKRSLIIRRADEAALAPATVAVATAPATATAGVDYTPVATTVSFAALEREKAVDLDALADATTEAPETYTVSLSQPTGDTRLGATSTATVTIADEVNGPGGGGGGAGAMCAQRAATVTGTSKRDVLRGTRGADVIAALGGKDKVKGLGGEDVVCGGPGKDRMAGGAGRDSCLGGPGRDRARCERVRGI